MSTHAGNALAQVASKASLLVRPAEYFGETYTSPPAEHSSYVFFENEHIRLELEIVNRGAQSVELFIPNPPVPLFRVVQGQAAGFALADGMLRKSPGLLSAGELTPTVTLAPMESLIFTADATRRLPPGEYVIDWETSIVERSGLRIAPQASRILIEVRASSRESAAEEARRNALRAFLAGQDVLADEWVGRLLVANPASYEARLIRAELSLRAGDKEKALGLFRSALQILETNGDESFVHHAAPYQVQGTITGIRQKIRAHER